MTALLALARNLLWGLADFGGGLLTRVAPALTVVVVSRSIAAVVLGAVVVATGAWSEAGPRLWFAVAAGLVGPVALAARGFLRERLRAVQAAGAGLALVGTLLLATG